MKAILQKFQEQGIKTVRLDAAGFVIKKPGMSIPETFDFIDELTEYARALGLEVLVEIYAYYRQQIAIAQRVDRVYDFVLPPLILHALFNSTSTLSETLVSDQSTQCSNSTRYTRSHWRDRDWRGGR